MEFTTSGLLLFGFSSPLSFKELQRADVLPGQCGARDIGGVYVVVRPGTAPPQTAEVVYIGKGSLGRPRLRGPRRGLWHRMRQYRNAVFLGGTSHDGGKLLRDLPDKGDFLIQALGIAEDHVICMEYFLIETFREEYKRMPLANIASPPKPPGCCRNLEQTAKHRTVLHSFGRSSH